MNGKVHGDNHLKYEKQHDLRVGTEIQQNVGKTVKYKLPKTLKVKYVHVITYHGVQEQQSFRHLHISLTKILFL